jgi:hypothetical protein
MLCTVACNRLTRPTGNEQRRRVRAEAGGQAGVAWVCSASVPILALIGCQRCDPPAYGRFIWKHWETPYEDVADQPLARWLIHGIEVIASLATSVSSPHARHSAGAVVTPIGRYRQ